MLYSSQTSAVVCSGIILCLGALLSIKECLDKKCCRLCCSFLLDVDSVMRSVFCVCVLPP